ncbi:MAG: hypothetical protein HC888_10080, partial [Candidatus Competibacteraceae bacterium]|nr:hypothetical protein [Candidatus Competibacteraceae bacterium]
MAAPSFASEHVTSGRSSGQEGSSWADLSAAVALQAANGVTAAPASQAGGEVQSRSQEEGQAELDIDLELALGLEPGLSDIPGLNGASSADGDLYDSDLSDGDSDWGDESDFVYMPKAQYDLEERLPDWAPRRLYGAPAEIQNEGPTIKFFSPGGDPGHERSDETFGPQDRRKRLSGQRAPAPLAISPEGNRGDRMETFPGGASMVKDGLGRVKEIRTTRGDRLEFYYDGKGHLVSFVRIDAQGNIHSRADQDRHGVLVRDGNGRVRAQGEAIHVDPFGCVSISRPDGQYWSLDLVRSVHIERRLLADEFGKWVSMTALFSADGFRMATRFSPVEQVKRTESELGTASGADLVKPHLRSGHGRYRFYGRDGSVIEFCSDRDLEELLTTNLLVRWYVGLPLTHPGPDHSTLATFHAWMTIHAPDALFADVLAFLDRVDPEDPVATPQIVDTFAMASPAQATPSPAHLLRHLCLRLARCWLAYAPPALQSALPPTRPGHARPPGSRP